jgi:hypothetical protein
MSLRRTMANTLGYGMTVAGIDISAGLFLIDTWARAGNYITAAEAPLYNFFHNVWPAGIPVAAAGFAIIYLNNKLNHGKHG